MQKNNMLAVAFLATGIYVLSVWICGSHGHVVFRPHMVEDWIISALVFLTFGLSFRFFVRK